MLFMHGNLGPGEEGYDIRTDEGALRAADRNFEPGVPRWDGHHPLSKRVGRLSGMADVSRLSQGALSPPEGISPITG